jgi:Las17-binding protein actin regulator
MIASAMTISPAPETKDAFNPVVFAAVSLDGTVVAPDHMADEALYGAGLHRETTLSGKVPVPEPARDLVAETRRCTGSQKSAQGRKLRNTF